MRGISQNQPFRVLIWKRWPTTTQCRAKEESLRQRWEPAVFTGQTDEVVAVRKIWEDGREKKEKQASAPWKPGRGHFRIRAGATVRLPGKVRKNTGI